MSNKNNAIGSWMIVGDDVGNLRAVRLRDEFSGGIPMFSEYGFETKKEAEFRIREIRGYARNGLNSFGEYEAKR